MRYELRSTEVFERWLSRIKDRETHARIVRRIDKLTIGAFGDCKALDSGLFELRMFFGPGYRVYYTVRGKEIIFLLAGGSKSTQTKDIAKAAALMKKLEE
jgi:putative addiction module killer protein